ncbi:class I adenylate-forming enzyme family protein [Mycobacterium florentinum]|uniref:class I adenylate-forming enzyme family protein n=1 Tax=Mycobacterium florentinum TaxID=292462 RepID=UPI000A14C2A8|nr:AMP-binding protein [Mycobacterium florentinum]MCV7412572.1 AMP-binding protein [Mycobacterium florentinum]BBX81955.1 fatty-acid--CoA ligase [Mycobacterium florentinum]
MPTIGGTALSNANRVGEREAIVTAERRWTWRALESDIAATAAALESFGVRKHDRVAILSANSAEFIIASHAASRLGAIVVPVNTRLAAPELAHILNDSGSAVLAFSPADAHLAESASRLAVSVALLSLGPSPRYPDVLAGGYGDPVHEDRAVEQDDAFILYTSGTTGKPKGVLLDHHRAVWAAMAQIVSLGLRDGDRYLHLAPMYHSGGMTYLNATTLLGGTHIVVPKFDAGTVLELVEQHRATWLFAVPTMYQRILNTYAGDAADLTSWRVGIFGAAPMPAAAIERLLAAFPRVSFFQQCGQTEAGPTGIYSTMEEVRSRPQSSGHLAQPFVEARVVDPSGNDTPPGQVGELIFRGEAITKGYWNQPQATAEVIRDGWLHTGDLMQVYDDGAMRLVDRLRDVIITGGRNVYSAEVELAIADHPEVTDVAVIGRPDPEWGETVVAFITAADGSEVTPASIRQYCASRIADYKIPREFIFAVVPRNGGGKLQKHLLRNQLSLNASQQRDVPSCRPADDRWPAST